MSEIDAKKITLLRLFGNEFFFKIPEYQRPYSWKTDNCEQLFDDILESDEENEYFLGTIILQEIEVIGTVKMCDIIDGQQRLTTIQILLSCLRDAVEDCAFKESLGSFILQPENPVAGVPERVRIIIKEKDYFRKYVQEVGSTKKVDVNDLENDIQKNIRNAIILFNEKIEKLKQSQIKSFIQYLSQKCIVIYVSTKLFDDAYRLFTITNDRGLQLRRIDILKAKNIDPKFIKDVGTRKEYALKWECMEDELGGDEFEKLIFFLRTIEVKEKAKEDLLKEFDNNIFAKGKVDKGADFIDYVYEYFILYKQLIIENNIDGGNGSVKFKNLLQIMFEHLKGNDWIPAILYYYKKFGKKDIFEFLEKLEHKYCYSWVSGKTKDKRLVDICSVIKKIDESESSNIVLKSNILSFNKEELLSFIVEEDFYKKPFAKYILIKLEYLSSENTTERRIGKTSIEHVLPRTPKENSQWVKDFSEDELIKWTNNIANLILLSKRKNSSASNLDFSDKKDKYFKEKIVDLPRSLQIMMVSEWTPVILEKRLKKIKSIILK